MIGTFETALALQRAGRLLEAEQAYDDLLRQQPENATAWHFRGIVVFQLGKPAEAAVCIARAVELKPELAEAYSDLGVAYQALGKREEALASYQRALHLDPGHVDAQFNLGTVLRELGMLDQAAVAYGRAVELRQNDAQAWNNFGIVFRELGQLAAAEECYRRALAIRPEFSEACNNLGVIFREQGKLDDAIACYQRAAEISPNNSTAYFNLGNALREQTRLDEAISNYRRALMLKPLYAEAHSNLLLTMQYCEGASPSSLAVAHAEFEQQQAAALRFAWQPHTNHRDSKRRLRIGFVSPDFGEHPVGFFAIGLLRHIDRAEAEVVCYNDRRERDELTESIRNTAAQWRDVAGSGDEQLAQQIQADEIDILFDLVGHTARNRLLVFARKPAPVQVTWLGYVGTTGLAAMDYLLADTYEIPTDSEKYYRERVLRMPNGYVCFEPPADAPSISELPALENGFLTFGSFNHPAKITGRTIAVWARILTRVARSRLVLKHQGFGDMGLIRRVTEAFANAGIERSRIECRGWTPHAEALAEYGDIDIGLDPFPYNGGLTTCEALWMGVPVITCPGETFASRHSLSHLSNAGMGCFVANSIEGYVEMARSLATDIPRLAELRRGLRERMNSSPLCDCAGFAKAWMRLMRGVWQEWCDSAQS
jgi:protein O-GlcNAc transferase